jgi:sugar phosphate isomerase/epimerase
MFELPLTKLYYAYMFIKNYKRYVTCISLCLLATFSIHAQSLKNDFFVFDNGAGRGAWIPEKQAKTLADLGYAGIGYTGTENLDERLAAFEKHGVRVFNIYVACYLDKEISYSDELVEAIKRLAGTDVVIWLTVQGKSTDDKAVRIVREIADLVAASNLKVVLYPHAGFYVADIEDALRITKKVNRENLGVTFNLCHELMAGNEAKFDELLERALPELLVISINGADHTGGWDTLIQPLGHGVFDLNNLLRKLTSLGYKGPIGLQCYNVPGSTEKNLKHNIAEWRKIVKGN